MSTSLFAIPNKVALVTGGPRGIGLNAATGFLEAGAAKVYITARDQAVLDDAVKQLNAAAEAAGQSGKAYAIRADLGSSAGVKKLVTEFTAVESKLDILFANAGVANDLSPSAEDADAKFDEMFAVNVRSVIQLVSLLKPVLSKAASASSPASVIITGSVAGLMNGFSEPMVAYAASKAAVHHAATLFAKQLAPDHIRVNALACGVFPTRMSTGFREKLGDSGVLQMVPLGRLGNESDIKGATLFLASGASAYVTGEVICLDGGTHL